MFLIFEREGGFFPPFSDVKILVLMCISRFLYLSSTHICGSDLLQIGSSLLF